MWIEPTQPLATVADLVGQRGGPFSEQIVAAESAAMRRLCGWHIAPRATLTVTLDGDGGQMLMLPTLRLNAQPQVTVDGKNVSDFTWSARGMLKREAAWPDDLGNITVVFDSGYQSCPPELFKVLAQRCQLRQVVQEAVGPFSQTFAAQSENRDAGDVLAKYVIAGRP